MPNIKLIALSTAIALVSFCANVSDVLAQFRENPCARLLGLRHQEPAKTLRTVKLPTLGISIDIPSNYRIIQRQSGSIEIVSPEEFEFLQCIAKHGTRGLLGGGRYAEWLKPLTQSEAMLKLEQDRQSDRQIYPYNKGNLEGFISANSRLDFGVSFVGRISDASTGQSTGYFEVVVYCDCPVELSDLLDLLERIKPLR